MAPTSIGLAIFEVKSDQKSDDTAEFARAMRHSLLAQVRFEWIDGYLEGSLRNLVRIELGLEEKPDAVSRPWDLV